MKIEQFEREFCNIRLVGAARYPWGMSKPSLASTHPELAAEAHGWDPSAISPGSGKKLGWKCKYGHVWDAVVCNRTRKNYGCPICSNKQILPGFNDLGTKFPEIASQAHGWDPRVIVESGGSKRIEHMPSISTYTYQLLAFADAIDLGKNVRTDAKDALAQAVLIDAAYLAAGLPPRPTFKI